MGKEATQFKTGNSGRPKGSRNKFSEKFIQAVYADFEEHGDQALIDLRESDLAAYMRTCVALVPKDYNLNVSDNRSLDEYSTEELLAIRDRLGAAAQAGREGESSSVH